MKIERGDKVLFTGFSKTNNIHAGTAKGYLKEGVLYTVSFVFPGGDTIPDQLEIEGVDDMLFLSDMFRVIKKHDQS